MNAISCQLNIKQYDQDIIYISPSLRTKLQLTNKKSTKISFGHKSLSNIKLATVRSNLDKIVLSSALSKKLYLPYSKKLMIKSSQNGIQIGPLVGILTTDTGHRHQFSKFFKHFLSPEANYPVYYFVFTPDQVNWQNKTVNGNFYSSTNGRQKQWNSYTVPLPDVIYNRVPNRTTEKKESIQFFKRQYKKLGGILFNPGFFSKWEMHQMISNDPRIQQYIPETYAAPSVIILQKMLEKYPFVYLKPTEGSLGLGIYKVAKQKNQYIVTYRNGKENIVKSYRSLAALYHFIFKRNQKKINKYLIQQGIDLIKFQGRPVDFRIQLHKNGFNEWNTIAIGAKAAGKGSVTTHIRTGGNLIDTDQFLKQTLGPKAYSIDEFVKDASIKIATVTEEKVGSPIGELGLDIGIDEQHRVWLFEVNSKPGRSIFKTPSLKKADQKSIFSILEYAMYLASFTI